MNLTDVHGDGWGASDLEHLTSSRALACAYAATLAESPINGLFLENVSIQGKCGQAFRCSAFVGNDTSGNIQKLYASGHAKNVNINGQDGIYAPNRCEFLSP